MADTTSTTSFRADISQLKSAMQQAARQVKLANSEFKAATAGLDDWSKSATGLNAKLKQLDTTLSSQKKQLSLLEKELELTTREYGANSSAADRVRVSINNQKAAISKTEKEIDKYNGELKNAEKYGDNFTNTMEDMNDATKEASDGFTVMKGALANLVADGIRKAVSALKDFAKETISVGASFEASMSKVGAISGATSEDIDKLTAKAKEMGEKTVFSASESAEAFQYMAMAGWKTEDMLNGIEGIMNLAAASGSDLATTSDIVTDALTAMGYSAGDAGRLADVMAAASSNANTNVEMMGATFQYAAPIIGALGMNMEDSAVAIGLMANAGIKGEKAGTALRSILTRLSTDAGASANSLGALGTLTEELGVQFYNTDGTVRDLSDVLGEARKAWSKLSAEQQTSYGKTIAGQEALSGWLAIMNAAPADVDKLTEAVQHADGAAQDMANTMNDNLQGQMTLLRSKIEGVQIQIYEHLAPAMKEAVGEIGNVVDSIDWGEVGEKLGDFALKLVKFAKKVIENFDGIVEVLKSVGTVLVATFVVNKIVSFVQTVQTVITAIKALKVATDTATASQKLLNLAQAATPIGLVTAAVAGLTTAVIYFAGKNKEAKQAVSNLTDAEKEQIKTIYEARDAYKEIKAARDEAVGSINSEYDNYKALSAELDDLVDANGNVKEGYEDRVNFILTTLNDAVGTEMELVDGVIQNYQEEKVAIDKLIETKRAEAVLDANKEGYTNAIKNQKQALQDFIDVQRTFNASKKQLNELEAEYERLSGLTVSQYAEEIGQSDNLIEAESQLIASKKRLKSEITSTKIAIGESHMAMDAAEQSYVSYNATIQNYEGLSSAIISGDADKISQALSNLNNDFITAETGTKQSLENQVTNLEEQYENMKQAVQEGSPVVTEEMVKEAKDMVDKAIEELDKFEDQAETSGQNGMQKFIDGMGSKEGDVNLKAELLRQNAAKTLGADTSAFEQAGLDAGQGYLNGLVNKEPDILDKSKSLGSDAVDALNAGQDSHSPSAKTTTSGENFGQGFINGMDNKTNSIWDKAYSIARLAISALKKGQKEGSPSKLTYKSGVNFVQGYINGIASQEKNLQTTVSKMVKGVVKELGKMSKYNFDDVGQNASEYFVSNISSRFSYMLDKITYQNNAQLEDFDKKYLNSQQSKKLKRKRLKQRVTRSSKHYRKNTTPKKIKNVKKQSKKRLMQKEKMLKS
jgi:phage tail tape measure protein, TP901 family, core region